MNHRITRFTVLVESRRLARWLASGLSLLAAAAALAALRPAAARQPDRPAQRAAALKISPDLATGIDAALAPRERWVREVLVCHGAIQALTAVLPAREVHQIAARSDVLSVTPNRAVRPTLSTLERITGAVTSAVRSSSRTSYSGYAGTGVGIAILDSAIQRHHLAFLDTNGLSRIKPQVNRVNTNDANWAGAGGTGVFVSSSTLSAGLVAGGVVLSQGMVLSEGLVLSETTQLGEP